MSGQLFSMLIPFQGYDDELYKLTEMFGPPPYEVGSDTVGWYGEHLLLILKRE